MPETRIALIMGGGVSLGSFSGGALAQIIHLLKEVKRRPAKIDVMSGASAGSMTLAVVAHHLFMGASDDEIEKALYNAWVDQIDLEHLIPKDLGKHKTPSLFSDEIINSIAEETIQTSNWNGNEANSLFAEGLKVSFSLTNLNGIPVRSEGQLIRQPVSGGGPATGKKSVFADAVQTTFHHDVIRFELRRNGVSNQQFNNGMRLLHPWNTEEGREQWKIFRKGAIASGAFPGAFPPTQLLRYKQEYGKYWPEELDSGQFMFDYLDGGITRNEPLREAIHLASLQDAGRDVERVYILVDPSVSGTNELYPLPYNQQLSLKTVHDSEGKLASMMPESRGYLGGLGGVVGRFLGVLASQATFRDWLKAAHYNSQIEWKDDLMEILDGIQPVPGSEAESNMDKLLERIYREKIVRSSPGDLSDEEVDKMVARISRDVQQHSEANDPDDFNAKLKLLASLVANLQGKRKLNMVAVTPASIEGGAEHRMAGDFMRSFGGFFEKKYRDYDYNVGKHIAAHVLNAPIENEEGKASRLLNEGISVPEAPQPIIPGPAYKNLDGSKRHMMEQFLKNHLDMAVSSLPVPTGVLRRLIRNKIAGKLTDSLMAQSVGHTHYIYIRFEDVNSNWLLKGSSGDDSAVSGNNIAETVIGIRKQVAGSKQYEMFGPHLHEVEGGQHHEFRFYKKFRRPWKNGEIKRTVRLKGDFQEWYSKACYNYTPDIIYSLNEESPNILLPSNVCAHVHSQMKAV